MSYFFSKLGGQGPKRAATVENNKVICPRTSVDKPWTGWTSLRRNRRNTLICKTLQELGDTPCPSQDGSVAVMNTAMRRTITISVSDEMHDLIYEGMRVHYYSTVSEYVRFLVRRDQRPDAVQEKKVVHPPARTMNQCMEDARREIEARKAVQGD